MVAAAMTVLGLHYLSKVKQGKLPLDPVARFHLGNGARIERLNWAADISAKGFNQSYSMMVNYRYLPESVANFPGPSALAGDPRRACSTRTVRVSHVPVLGVGTGTVGRSRFRHSRFRA